MLILIFVEFYKDSGGGTELNLIKPKKRLPYLSMIKPIISVKWIYQFHLRQKLRKWNEIFLEKTLDLISTIFLNVWYINVNLHGFVH